MTATTARPNVRLLRVLGTRSSDPGVLAFVDGNRVNWKPNRGWSCECRDDLDVDECQHIATVRDLLDARILTPQPLRAT